MTSHVYQIFNIICLEKYTISLGKKQEVTNSFDKGNICTHQDQGGVGINIYNCIGFVHRTKIQKIIVHHLIYMNYFYTRKEETNVT